MQKATKSRFCFFEYDTLRTKFKKGCSMKRIMVLLFVGSMVLSLQARQNFGWELVGIDNQSDLTFTKAVRGVKQTNIPGLTKEVVQGQGNRLKSIKFKKPCRMVGKNNVSFTATNKQGAACKLSFVGAPSYKIASGRNNAHDIVPKDTVVVQALDIGAASMAHNVAQVFVTKGHIGEPQLAATSSYEKAGTRYLLQIRGNNGQYAMKLLLQK